MRSPLKIFAFIALFSFVANVANASLQEATTRAIAQPVLREAQSILWNSEVGLKRLEAAKYKNDFYQLVNFFQPQINPVYCAIASSVIVLNAFNYGEIKNQKELAIAKPETLGGGELEYNLYSQINFLNAQTDKIKKREIIEFKAKNASGEYDAGLSLTQLADILKKVHKLRVEKIHANKIGENELLEFRIALKRYLSDKNHFLLVNFDGKILGTKIGGHISPLVAYDEASDSVLVFDVALHKHQWYWADVTTLYEAMNSKDGKDYRGYLVLSKK